jgi:hypothetical protein
MTELLQDIFEKPDDRPIDGVIKADDEASLGVELDEYVITDEIARRLEDFLEAYNNYDTSNGVWISGFFGSGKSHLLKMLALVLENRDLNGRRAAEIFGDKLKDQPMLKGALDKAVSTPSMSILFNIDQKADGKVSPRAVLPQQLFSSAMMLSMTLGSHCSSRKNSRMPPFQVRMSARSSWRHSMPRSVKVLIPSSVPSSTQIISP